MRKTMQNLIIDVEKLLYQEAGPATQIYSEGIIQFKLQNAFDTVFSAKHWPQFRKREVRTLNGTTGLVTVPFTFIKQWDDVQHVFRRYSARPLTIMPSSMNSLDIQAGSAKYLEPTDDTNLFVVHPLTATDQIVVTGRARPLLPYGMADVVPFDHLALIYFALWSYFTDDQSNPGAAAKYQGLFDSRMKQLEQDAFGNAVLINPAMGDIPMAWR